MKRSVFLWVMFAFVVSASQAAADDKMMGKNAAKMPPMESSMMKMKDGSMMMSMEDMKWSEIPDSGGVMVAPAYGEMMKGAYGAFIKFPAGVKHPMHTHTNDVKAVVLKGTFWWKGEDGQEMKVGPMGYFMIPGKVKHESGCAEGSECVMFQVGDKKFDMKMDEKSGKMMEKK